MLKELDFNKIKSVSSDKEFLLKKQDEFKNLSEELLSNINNFNFDSKGNQFIQEFEMKTENMADDINKFFVDNKNEFKSTTENLEIKKQKLIEINKTIENLTVENQKLKNFQVQNIDKLNEKIDTFSPTQLKTIELGFDSEDKFNALWKIIMEKFFDCSSSNYHWDNMKLELSKDKGEFFIKKLKLFKPTLFVHLDYSNLKNILVFEKLIRLHVLNIDFHIFLDILNIMLNIRKEYEKYIDNKNKLKLLDLEKKSIDNNIKIYENKFENNKESNEILVKLNSLFKILT